MKTTNLLSTLVGVAVVGMTVQGNAQQSAGTTNAAQSQGNLGGAGISNTANSGIVHQQNLQRQQNLWRTPDGQIVTTNAGGLQGQSAVRQPRWNRGWVRQPVPQGASPYSPAVTPPGASPVWQTGTNIMSGNPQLGQRPLGQPGSPVIQPGAQPNVGNSGFGTSMVPPGGQTAIGQPGTAIGPQGQLGIGQPNTAISPQLGQPLPATPGTLNGMRPEAPRPAIGSSQNWGTTLGARWNDPRFVFPDGMGARLRQNPPVFNNGNGFRPGGAAGNVGGAVGGNAIGGSTSGAGGGSTGGSGGATSGGGGGK